MTKGEQSGAGAVRIPTIIELGLGYKVEAAWDEGAGVWYTKHTTLPGLHIEAATLDDFRQIATLNAETLIGFYLSQP